MIWDKVLIFLLPIVGLFFTIYLSFPQFARLGAAFKQTFGGLFDKEENARRKAAGEISSFQALAVAIAAQIGTGNVAGVATAILSGGPGAIFWMWLAAIFGMGTIFAEAVLAQKFRTLDKDGETVGGPSFYISQGIQNKGLAKFLAGFFSVAIILALGFIGNMVQSNSMASAINEAFGVPTIAIGIVIAILAALVFIGGIKRIANFAEMVVPIMALVYVGLAIFVLIKFRSDIGKGFGLIFEGAFNPQAALGAGAGITVKLAIRFGVARGLFSNEAGMGSTPHAHATAKVNHPVEQGLTAMLGVLIDTGIVCTATALVIILTGAYSSGKEGPLMTQEAFGIAFPGFGKVVLAICLTAFAFTTVIGWYYFGETNIRYLFGKKGLLPYRIIVVVCIVLGSVFKIDFVWNLSDFFNGLMVFPNLVGLLFLHKHVKALTKDYDRLKQLGKITYDYEYEHK
ncbi:MAG: sodium:alanine symporter family protein [Lagierella massiliensis]|nr:sodium:alanine symporter family protein [Lagierella massiliensis]